VREALFIKKNRDKWTKIQQSPAKDADQLANDFTELVNDLAYAKTFYPTSKVTKFLNGQASKIYLSIYQNRKEESNRLATFWKYDLPLTVRKHHGTILLLFIFFSLFFIIGFFSSWNNPTYMREMIGEDYVNMTEENIANGNPFGIYQTGTPFIVWIGIFINNTVVALTYYAKGILFGIPTILSLLRFGVEVGAFDYMFASRGLAEMFVLTVFIHGTLEITSIIFASAAGVILGKSFLFPGTIGRWASFKQGAKDGLKIIVGIIPVLMIAAFFESFVTRHYRMHWGFSLSILFASFLFIVWYFIIYPIQLQKRFQVQTNVVAQA